MRESHIPFLVEARDYARLPVRFHGEIERDYVVIVGGHSASAGHRDTHDAPDKDRESVPVKRPEPEKVFELKKSRGSRGIEVAT